MSSRLSKGGQEFCVRANEEVSPPLVRPIPSAARRVRPEASRAVLKEVTHSARARNAATYALSASILTLGKRPRAISRL